MNLGTVTVRPLLAIGSPVMPVRRMGDIEETRLLIEDRNRARAVEYLIADRASSRQDQVHKMALAATEKAAQGAAETQLAILDAGDVAHDRLSKNLTVLAITVVGALVLLKAVATITKPKEKERAA